MKRFQSNKFFLAALLLAIAGLVATFPIFAGAEEIPSAIVSGPVSSAPPGPVGSVPPGPIGPVPPDINTYLKNLYFWFLGVVGISALFAIVFGGVLYMFSGTSLTKVEQARHWISNAIFGILLAGGSYVLLKAINPDFTEHGFDLTNSINRLLPPPIRTATAPASSSAVSTGAPVSAGAVGPRVGGSLLGTGQAQ